MRNLLRYGAITVLLTALVACDSGGSGSPSNTMTDAQILDLGKELAQCVRQNGVPNFPDPTVQDGKLIMPRNQPEAELDKATVACRTIAERLPQAADSGTFSAEDIVKLREWSQCLRENGLPEWPDPNADGSFAVEGTPLDGKTERLQRAREACKKYWDKGWRVS